MGIFVDRSVNNGHDNYREAHTSYLYAKASEGVSETDGTYHERILAGRAARAVVGAYHYGLQDEPVAEANHFLAVIGKPKTGDLRPCVDVEDDQTIEWVVAFAERVREVLGYWPALYGNTSTIAGMRRSSAILAALPWWRAEYGPNDGALHALEDGDLGCAAHQYTSVAEFTGIDGHTDASVMMRPDLIVVPRLTPPRPRPLPAKAWKWARWKLGIAEYAGHAGDRELRPHDAPRRIPISWWRAPRWYKRHGLPTLTEPQEEA